ncbi:MAG: DUF2339 domain-containing protein, partial [Pseudomonadota bacterium]
AAAIFVLFERVLPGQGLESHWGIGLMAAMWLVACVAQLRQFADAGLFEKVLRLTVACAIGLLVVAALVALFTVFNPLTASRERVLGLPFLSSLALAYLPIASVFALAAWRIQSNWRYVKPVLYTVAAAFALWYLALSIRHIWQGPKLSNPGVTDPELYSYTIAMLLLSAGLLMLAFLRRNAVLRRVAMIGVGLTIAKVFLIDMSDLTGLIRVVSFLGLGVSLMGLTWLSRVMDQQWDSTSRAAQNNDSDQQGENET